MQFGAGSFQIQRVTPVSTGIVLQVSSLMSSRISVVRCRQCSSGHLQPSMITGQGRGIRVKALERLALPPGAPRVLSGD